jgi:hypothetical protein
VRMSHDERLRLESRQVELDLPVTVVDGIEPAQYAALWRPTNWYWDADMSKTCRHFRQ